MKTPRARFIHIWELYLLNPMLESLRKPGNTWIRSSVPSLFWGLPLASTPLPSTPKWKAPTSAGWSTIFKKRKEWGILNSWIREMWKANDSSIGVYFFSIHWETKEETNPFSKRKFPLNTKRMVSQSLATHEKVVDISQTKSELCITNTKTFL